VSQKIRVEWIDAVKAICILMVVLGHTLVQVDFSNFENFEDPIVQKLLALWLKIHWWAGPIRMPVFFFISGFLAFSYVLKVSWRDSVYKRVVFYLWIFVIWSLLLFFFTYSINYFDGFRHEFYSRDDLALYSRSFIEMLPKLFLGNGGLWYIYALLLYFVTSKLFSEVKIIGFLLATTLFVWAVLKGGDSGLGWGSLIIIKNWVFFATGCYFGPQIINFFSSVSWKKGMLICFLWIMAIVAHKFFKVNYTLVGVVASIPSAIFFGCQFEKMLKSPKLAWVRWVGENTVYIYLLHVLFIQIIFFVVNLPMFHIAISNNVIFAAFMAVYPIFFTVLSSLLSILLGLFLKKNIPLLFSPPRKFDIFSKNK